MAKSNFLESANGIQKGAKELLERLALTQSAVGELLVSVRHSESELLEKEEEVNEARVEELRSTAEMEKSLAQLRLAEGTLLQEYDVVVKRDHVLFEK